jgi:hypothetical protein
MQVFVAEFNTAFKFVEANAIWFVLGVVAFAGTGLALRLLGRALRGGKEG